MNSLALEKNPEVLVTKPTMQHEPAQRMDELIKKYHHTVEEIILRSKQMGWNTSCPTHLIFENQTFSI